MVQVTAFRKPFTTIPMSFTFRFMFTGTARFTLGVMTGIGIIAEKTTVWASKCFQVSRLCSHDMLTAALRNVNIPWPTQGMGDGDYMYAFQEVVMPIAYEFDPDLVISEYCVQYMTADPLC